MIFFADAKLTIQKSIPRPMNQGSSEADEFVLVAPIPANSTVSVAFKLPNGVYTEPHFVNPATGKNMALVTPELIGFTDQAGNRYTVWVYIPDRLMTSLPGVLSVQFFATNSQGDTRASSLATITIGKGVPYIAPSGSATDVYQEILAYLSSVMQSEDNAEFWAKISQSYANGTIDEATAKITATPEGTTATINQLVFLAKVGYTVADKVPKEYVFTWDGEQNAWYLTITGTSGSTEVVLSEYGITLAGDPNDASELIVEASVGFGTVHPGDPGYQDNAKYYADKAKDSQTASEQAKVDAVSAMEVSIQAKNDAVSAKNEAIAAKNDAITAKNDAITAKNDAIAAKNDAIAAKNDAIAAKNDAKQSADAAEEALGQFTDLSEEFGASLDMTIDNNFILAVSLKNRSGYVLSEKSVDLPIESMVVDASYNPATKEIVLTLQNGNTISVPVDDLVDGLASETYVRTYVAANTVSTVDGRRGAVTTCLRIDYGDENAYQKISDAISKNQRIICVYKDYAIGMTDDYTQVELTYSGQDVGIGAQWFSADLDGISYQANVTPDNYWTIDSFDDKNTQAVKYVEQTLTDSQKSQARENIGAAATDGYYGQMGVGQAEQLISTVGVTEKVPYNFRTSGGSADIGNRLNDKIVGGTICWNQLSVSPRTGTSNGLTFTSEGNGRCHITGTVTTAGNIAITFNPVSIVAGHKYLLSIRPTGTYTGTISFGYLSSFTEGNDSDRIYDCKKAYTDRVFAIEAAEVGDSYDLHITLQVFDLTAMFGSTIADYVYSIEQTTAGAGVEWFNKLFPKPYYKRNAGELMSVCTNEHITRGFNSYNHANGTAKLVGGKQYQITGAYTSLAYSTGETISPNESGLFTPTESGVLTVTGGNATDTCVHLVWSGYRNGEYEPYVEHRYPLSALELRGIPKLDSANNLYFDGDTYEKDGTVTRRYGIVDMGTLSWEYATAYTGNERFFATIGDIKLAPYSSSKGNLICSKYITETADNVYTHKTDKVICSHNVSPQIWVYDSSYNDAASFKAAMLGVYLVYELATPTTETANPFTDPQIVDDFGTEEYVDALATAEMSPRDVAIPVGHETFYQANLRDKLQNLPANANADGLYLVKQTGNKQELIAYTPEDELPESPAETGTYILKLVDGTLTWVLES